MTKTTTKNVAIATKEAEVHYANTNSLRNRLVYNLRRATPIDNEDDLHPVIGWENKLVNMINVLGALAFKPDDIEAMDNACTAFKALLVDLNNEIHKEAKLHCDSKVFIQWAGRLFRVTKTDTKELSDRRDRFKKAKEAYKPFKGICIYDIPEEKAREKAQTICNEYTQARTDLSEYRKHAGSVQFSYEFTKSAQKARQKLLEECIGVYLDQCFKIDNK